MPNERILIEFSDEVDGSPELVATAGRVAFSFSTTQMDRPAGVRNGVVYTGGGHHWWAYWTKARAVSVRCVERVVPCGTCHGVREIEGRPGTHDAPRVDCPECVTPAGGPRV